MTAPAIAVWLGVFVLAAGCSSSSPEEGSTLATATTEAPATTTTTDAFATTSTTVTTTTTTAAPGTTSTIATTTAGPTTTRHVVGTPTLFPPAAGSDGAAGSGCSPGTETLPDGVWFGSVVARDGSTIEFDLACFYFGDLAYEKGAEAGVEVANDYFVSNENPGLRSVDIANDILVYEIDSSAPDTFVTVQFADWPLDPSGYTACPGTFCIVWLYVNDGEVTEMVEQYVP